MSAARRLAILGFAALTGCAAPGPAPETIPQRPLRETIRDFALEARVAVRNAEQSAAANVSWTRNGALDHLLVTSPLGQGIAEMRGAPGSAELSTADRQHYSAPDLDTLSERVFGARLPLSGLPDWIVGRPTGAAATVERDAEGRLARLEQDGWRVEYTRYETPRPDALPELLRLQRGELEIRIRIDQWSLAP